MRKLFKQYSKPFKKMLYIFFVLLSVYIAIRFIFPFFAPFLIAFLIAIIIEPIVTFLETKLKVRRGLGAAVSLLFGVAIVGIILVAAISRLFEEAIDLVKFLTESLKSSDKGIPSLLEQVQIFYYNLNPEVVAIIQESINNFLAFIRDIVSSVFNYSKLTIISLPKVFIGIIVTLISAYFISTDKPKILTFMQKQLPPAAVKKFNSVRVDILKAFGGYLKAMLTIMAITYFELVIGLSLMGVSYPLVLALLIAIIDILPVLGTGTILIPWMIWHLIMGNISLALSLLILYCVIMLVRQLFEPKIVGANIGVHPLITLLAMYTGLNLFGVLGMILGPIVVLIVKNLQSAGLMHLWND